MNPTPPSQNQPRRRKGIGSIFIWPLIFLGVIFVIYFFTTTSPKGKITDSEVIREFSIGNIEYCEYNVSNNRLSMWFRNGSRNGASPKDKPAAENGKPSRSADDYFTVVDDYTWKEYILPYIIKVDDPSGNVKALEINPPADAQPGETYDKPTGFKEVTSTNYSFLLTLLPAIAVIIVAIVLVVVYSRKAASAAGDESHSPRNFGRARTRLGTGDKKKVYFDDVAGADEEKEELQEIVEYLRDPQRFTKLGAKIPHGVLLLGPPGTGKTLLAKAVAGEAGVPFYSISGSDFMEMYVGVGASRVRDLFETARRHPAAIIFIDEIDAVGRQRGTGLGGGHDEREQTLNQLLVEMDGFGTTEGIIIIAATNRADILDPALLRPGRFDRQIVVGYPDIKGREAILKVHAKGKSFEQTVDFSKVAQTTIGFTGADLANLLNESALIAARKGKSLIGMNDIDDAFIKIIAGPQKKSKVIDENDKKNTAYHEAAHAIVGHVVSPNKRTSQISLIPAGMAAGYTLHVPVDDRRVDTKGQFEAQIAMLLAGRIAEKMIMNDYTAGASQDMKRATSIARNMVMRYGMSELGPIVYGSDHGEEAVFLGRDFSASRNYSEETAAKIDAAIAEIIDRAYERAEQILKSNMEKLHFIASYLLKYEVMDEAEFLAAMAPSTPTIEEVYAIGEEKRRISAEENEGKKKLDEERRQKLEADREAERQRLMNEARGRNYPPNYPPNK